MIEFFYLLFVEKSLKFEFFLVIEVPVEVGFLEKFIEIFRVVFNPFGALFVFISLSTNWIDILVFYWLDSVIDLWIFVLSPMRTFDLALFLGAAQKCGAVGNMQSLVRSNS